MGLLKFLGSVLGLRPKPKLHMSYKDMMILRREQAIHGIDMTPWADKEGRIQALLCDCGRFRRDKPPGTYICACFQHLDTGVKKLMCPACSKKILDGRSSYATYIACDECQKSKEA